MREIPGIDTCVYPDYCLCRACQRERDMRDAMAWSVPPKSPGIKRVVNEAEHPKPTDGAVEVSNA